MNKFASMERRLAEVRKHLCPFKTVFIKVRPGEQRDDAIARHHREHPEDKDADLTVVRLYFGPLVSQ